MLLAFNSCLQGDDEHGVDENGAVPRMDVAITNVMRNGITEMISIRALSAFEVKVALRL